eukprot:TRINITY_DN2737_c0_g1_i1.p1 TRINITY_DN2737_c0_g1~~TRINITY_DN2737_c0_g1_i1.p1  ORF type:complete len:293 (+),score=48.09 TRINITY_DN2737_c0_g1_i1:3-881(+)
MTCIVRIIVASFVYYTINVFIFSYTPFLLFFFFFFLMIRRPPRSTLSSSSAASDVYKRQMLAMMGARGARVSASVSARVSARVRVSAMREISGGAGTSAGSGRGFFGWTKRVIGWGFTATGVAWWGWTLVSLGATDPERVLHEMLEADKEEELLSKFYDVPEHTASLGGCEACIEIETKEEALRSLYTWLVNSSILKQRLGPHPVMRLCHAKMLQGSMGCKGDGDWNPTIGLEAQDKDDQCLVDLSFCLDQNTGQWVPCKVELWEVHRAERSFASAHGPLPHGLSYSKITHT